MPLVNFLKKLFKQKGKSKKKPLAKKGKKPIKKKPKPKISKKKTLKKRLAKRNPIRKPKKKTAKPKKKITVKKSKTASAKTRPQEIGLVTHYFGKISVAIIKLKRPLRVGDRIQIKGAQVDFSQTVRSMQYNHKDISIAKKAMEVGIKVPQPVHQNNKVYLAGE